MTHDGAGDTTTEPSIRPGPGWADVVYGRTRHADFWWRAVPSWTEQHGMLRDLVDTVLGGGHGLATGPRFLLARAEIGTLVGVACRARTLDDVMHTDGSRPLFTFVGWLHPPTDDPVAIPELEPLEAGYVEWAAPVYARWMTPAWEEHPSKLRDPERSDTGPAPWPEHAPSPAPAFGSRPERIRLHPAAGRFPTWARAAAAPDPIALTTGWTAYRDGLHLIVTDVCADDVDATTPDTVARPTPPTPEPPPAEQSAATPLPPERPQAESAPGPGTGAARGRVPDQGVRPAGPWWGPVLPVPSVGRILSDPVGFAKDLFGVGEPGRHHADDPSRDRPATERGDDRRAGPAPDARRSEQIEIDGPAGEPGPSRYPPWERSGTSSGPGVADRAPDTASVADPEEPSAEDTGTPAPEDESRSPSTRRAFGHRTEVRSRPVDPDDDTFSEFD